jgi:general secretion pathway protein H
MHRSRVATAGFTLIEIAVVLVIVAVAASLLVPHFVDRDQEELRRAGRAMAGALELASEEAALRGYPLRLTVDLDAQHLRLEVADDAGKYGPLGDGLLQDLLVRPPVRILGVAEGEGSYRGHGEVALLFPPDGVTEPIRLKLGVEQGAPCELFFNPVLDKVTLLTEQTCG